MTSIVKSIIASFEVFPIDPLLLAVFAILVPGIIVFLIAYFLKALGFSPSIFDIKPGRKMICSFFL